MNKFEECKKEWLKRKIDIEKLYRKIKNNIKIIENEQSKLGIYFELPYWEERIDKKRFFNRCTKDKVLICPCCHNDSITKYHFHFGGNDQFDYAIYTCSNCRYIGIKNSRNFLYSSNIDNLKTLNRIMDKYIENIS